MAKRLKLLMLSPQPRDLDPIDNRADAAKIRARLNELELPQVLQPIEKINPRFVDLPFWLTGEQPALIHFSGHGTQQSDLVFVNDRGDRHYVPPDAVAAIIQANSDVGVRGIVLNTCYSRGVAELLLPSVDFVVSTATEIRDEASVHFAETFYPLLAKGLSLKVAFANAQAQVLANRSNRQDPPTLLLREGIDPASYFLEGPAARSRDERPREDSAGRQKDNPPKPLAVIYCWDSPDDSRLVDGFLTQLRAARIPFWDPSQVGPGADHERTFTAALQDAGRIVLLESADMQAMESCQFIRALVFSEVKRREAELWPVQLRPCLPDPQLARAVFFPSGGRSMAGVSRNERDRLWLELVRKLGPAPSRQN